MTARLPARAVAAAVAALAIAFLAPAAAEAHGLVQRANLPIPEWLFGWAAAAVLIVSFVALAVLWPRPKLQEVTWHPLPRGIGETLGNRPVEIACGAIGAGLLAVLVGAGSLGTANSENNFAPTFILITFWVGLAFVSALLGDVFRAFNPWRATGRATGWLAARLRGGREPAHRPYPDRLGRCARRPGPPGVHLDRAGFRLGPGPAHAGDSGVRLQRPDVARDDRVRRGGLVCVGGDLLGLLQPVLADLAVRDA